MGIKLTNNANATLAASINSSATSITLTSGQGARFPTLAGGDHFYATLVDTSNNLEIVKCTARSTDVLTVVRAQESTTARAYNTGDRIEIRLTAQTFIDAVNEIGPTQVSDEANSSTGYFALPVGTTAQRPGTPATGMQRMNTSTNYMEYYNGSSWLAIAIPYGIEYLVVAGGGSGGSGNGGSGGGGAGGYIDGSVTVAPTTGYAITIGGGGAATADIADTVGNDGSSTTFSIGSSTLTAVGGGGGGAWNGKNGRSGGSGGGGGGLAGSGASGSSGQGYAGGYGVNNTSPYAGGGGGGAGAVGGSTAGSPVSPGGTGKQWLNSTYYAGGGGAGTENGNTAGNGGNGGGGRGGYANVAGTAGSANTGGGGGGGGYPTNKQSGAGGSGIVVIRYPGSTRGSGGTVTSSGGYTYHTFTTSGTFTA